MIIVLHPRASCQLKWNLIHLCFFLLATFFSTRTRKSEETSCLPKPEWHLLGSHFAKSHTQIKLWTKSSKVPFYSIFQILFLLQGLWWCSLPTDYPQITKHHIWPCIHNLLGKRTNKPKIKKIVWQDGFKANKHKAGFSVKRVNAEPGKKNKKFSSSFFQIGKLKICITWGK